MIPLIPIVSAALSATLIAVDWIASTRLEDSASQLQTLMEAFRYGMDFDTFVSECWMILLFGFFATWAMLALAFPARRRRGVA